MLEPFNRYVVVEPIEEEEETSDLAIVLPDNYSKPTSPYVLCEVLSVSAESKYQKLLNRGNKIVIERSGKNEGKGIILDYENQSTDHSVYFKVYLKQGYLSTAQWSEGDVDKGLALLNEGLLKLSSR